MSIDWLALQTPLEEIGKRVPGTERKGRELERSGRFIIKPGMRDERIAQVVRAIMEAGNNASGLNAGHSLQWVFNDRQWRQKAGPR
jgi:hypothetical protein